MCAKSQRDEKSHWESISIHSWPKSNLSWRGIDKMQHQGKYLGRRCWLSLMDTLGLATTFSSALLVRMTWIDQVYFISLFSMQTQSLTTTINHMNIRNPDKPRSCFFARAPSLKGSRYSILATVTILWGFGTLFWDLGSDFQNISVDFIA